MSNGKEAGSFSTRKRVDPQKLRFACVGTYRFSRPFHSAFHRHINFKSIFGQFQARVRQFASRTPDPRKIQNQRNRSHQSIKKKVRSFGRAAWRSIGVTFSSFGRHSRYLPSLSLSPSSARLPHHHYPLTLGSTMKVVLNLLALSATLHLQTSNVAAFGVSTLPGAARPFATSQLRSDAYSYSYGGGGSSAEPQNTSGDAAASSAPGDDGRVVRWFC